MEARDLPYRRWRPALFLGLVPCLMLFELDRELAADEVAGATARMVLDMLLVLTCARDLIRPSPNHPRITSIIFFGAAARLALLVTKSCGKNAHPVIYAASFLAFLASAMTLWLSPRPKRADPEVAPTSDDAALVATPAQGSFALALPIAVLLPIALVVTGRYLGIWPQALVLALWGAFLPQLAARSVDSIRPRRSAYFSGKGAIAWIVVGIAFTAGLTGGAHYTIDSIAAVIACSHGTGASQASNFMAKESTEVVRNVHQAREDIAFFFMTVFVSPFFEERVYRGMLQRVAGERFGTKRGIAIAATVFGLAHLGVYRVAIYQTILLGVSFGVVFEEGGLIAAIATHAIWNLYLLL